MSLGQAINLNGSTQCITAGDNCDFNYNEPFSIGVWFKTTSAAGDLTMVSKNNSGYTLGWAFRFAGGGLTGLLVQTWGSKGVARGTTVGGFNDGNWHRGWMVYDGSNTASGLRFYCDANLLGESAWWYGAMDGATINANNLTFGATNSGGAYFFPGSLDEVVIMNRVITGPEVTADYAAGRGKYHMAGTNIVGIWHLDNNALDSSGNGYNGALVGAPGYIPGKVYKPGPTEGTMSMMGVGK